nr:MAG TPA: hypothetical protein [Caudoviricetes sp.]
MNSLGLCSIFSFFLLLNTSVRGSALGRKRLFNHSKMLKRDEY